MTTDQLYNLLPALYRLRDTALSRHQFDTDTDGQLRTLLSLVAEQVTLLEEDLAQLYDDQFIETCAEWVVPYIGDLVGVQGLTTFPDAQFSQRGEVANALRFRRRKGTAAMLEQVARDVTGWDSSVVEYFQQLATTQYLNHLRPGNQAMASVRNPARLELASTPFDPLAHTAEVRRIEPGRGRYNIPNIGIFLWRISSFPITRASAYRAAIRRYTFDPLGRDLPLYNRVVVDDEITNLAGPANVPMPFTRLSLAEHLRLVRRSGPDAPAPHYGPGLSLCLWVDGAVVDQAQIESCDLSGWANVPANHYAIDPTLGRIACPTSLPAPARLHVSYHYGFSMALGGGEYERTTTFQPDLPVTPVTLTGATALQDAIAALPATGGCIEIRDNETYPETPAFVLAAGQVVELRAANRCRPVLALSGDLTVVVGANSQLILNGLLISGGCIRVTEGADWPTDTPARLTIRHCTLPPGDSPAIRTPVGDVPAQPRQPRLVIEAVRCAATIEYSILGSLRIASTATVCLSNSLVDATAPTQIAYAGLIPAGQPTAFDLTRPGGTLTVNQCTVIGKVHCRQLAQACNTIFEARLAPVGEQWRGPVWVSQRQQPDPARTSQTQYCVRFSFVPPGSRVPRMHRCQPVTPADAVRISPVLTSVRCGEAGYGQLSQRSAIEIRLGADDGAEMGVFHDLFQPQRLANLRTRLREYLRFGLEAGIFDSES